MNFSIDITKQAHDDLKRLPAKIQRQVSLDVQTLTKDPFPQGTRIKKLKGFSFSLYRLRTGDFRVLYRVDEQQITLMRVIDRKLLDRILSSLR